MEQKNVVPVSNPDKVRPAGDGFNREWAVIESIRDGKSGETLGYSLETQCGTVKKYLYRYFTDPYVVAIAALNSHQCPTPKEKDK